MSDESMEISTIDDAWKMRAMVIGGVLGAALGVASAYLLVQNREDEGSPQISAGEGVKLGVLAFTLLRNIANL